MTKYPTEDSTYNPDLTCDLSDFDEDNSASFSVAQVLPSEINASGGTKLQEELKSREATNGLESIEKEFDTIVKLGTYFDADPNHSWEIPSGITLRLKSDHNGSPAHFKVRIVARETFRAILISPGYMQSPEI